MRVAKDINIVVIDEEQVILDMFSRILGIKGYNVICAKDGSEAIEVAKNKKIDLAFIDVKLPGRMNGVDTFKQLKKVSPVTKAVMMSGFYGEKKLREAVKNGAVGYMKKPFDNIQDIYDLIEKTLGSRKD